MNEKQAMAEVEDFAQAELEREAQDLEARLERARAAREEAEATLAPTPLDELRERVEVEERAARNAAAMVEARKLGKRGVAWDVVDVPDGRIVIIKRAHPAAVKMVQDLERLTTEDTEQLVRPCVTYPPAAEYDAIADVMPGVVSTAAMKIMRLAGVRQVELRGK